MSTFMLDRYEVTVARFRRFVTARGLSAGAGFDERTGSYCNWTATARAPVDREGYPMNCVNWQTAQDFCGWDTPGGALRNRETGTCLEEDPAFAMGATPSPEGVWHLVGNVWEWTRDWYAPYPDPTCWNGQTRTDPMCAKSAIDNRSFRGGSWANHGASLERSGARNFNPPSFRSSDLGFRCAGTLR